MAIDAKTIEEKDFAMSVFRGYKVSEVDDFLDEVSEEIDRLQKRNGELEAQVTACQEKEKRIAEMEQTLRDTLITAQRAAEDVIRASREKAAAMVKDSELEGRRIVEEAELQAKAAEQRRDAISRDAAGVKAMIRRVIGEQLRLLEESYPDTQEQQPAAAQPASRTAQPGPDLFPEDLDRTQVFNVREVREQAMEEERAEGPRIKNLLERLPQSGQNGEVQA